MGIRTIWRKGKLLIIGLLLIGNVMANERRQQFLKELAQKIRTAEGTTDERAAKEGYASGYDVTLGYGKYDGDSDKPISKMTLSELKNFQKQMINRSKGKIKGTKYGSSAAGAYQFTRSTLFGKNGLIKKAGLSMEDTFSPENQDKLYEALLQEDKIIDKLQQGKPKAAQKKVAGRWASMTDFSGTPRYKQQRSPSAKAQDKAVKDLFYNTAEGFILNKEEPMAKENKQSLLGPLKSLQYENEEGIDTVMQGIQPEAREQLQMSIEKDSTMANVQKDPKQEVSKMIQEQKAARQPASEGVKAKENIETTRQGLDQGFKDALMYFGPRLGAMILGGTEAAEITDRVMTGFERYQAGKQPKPKDTKQDLAERKFAFEKQKFKAGQEEKERAALQKDKEENEKLLTGLNTSLKRMVDAQTYLEEGGITGIFDASIRRQLDRAVGNPKEQGRLLLESLGLEEKLLRTAEMKGAISDREFKELGQGIPRMSDDEKVWQDWIARKQPILQKSITNIKQKLGESTGSERARLEALRAKYGRR